MRFRLTTPLLLLVLCGQSAGSLHAADLLIENVYLVSAHLESPGELQHVLIRDGRIAAISSEPTSDHEDVARHDGKGRFLAPGLTDAHHHVSFAPGLGPLGVSHAAKNPGLANAYVDQQPRSLLYYGVTQILDPSPLTSWPLFESSPQHPDLFRCGEIPNEGGYPLNQIADTRVQQHFPFRLKTSSDEAIDEVIGRIADGGAICVKLYIENGFGDADTWPIFDEDTIRRIGDAARSRGLFVYAHANAIDMYQVALRSEVDVIGHGLWNWQWQGPGEPPVEETLMAVLESGAGYMATHTIMAGLVAQLNVDLIDKSRVAQVTPGSLLDWYETEEAQWFAEELASDFPPSMSRSEMADIMQHGYRRAQRSTKWLFDNGHPLLFGSDCPGSPSYANQPGLCTRQEIESHIDAGIPPAAVFEAATLTNARRLGIEDLYGTIEVGKIANLLIMQQDPTVSAGAYDTIDVVVLRGEPINREALAAE